MLAISELYFLWVPCLEKDRFRDCTMTMQEGQIPNEQFAMQEGQIPKATGMEEGSGKERCHACRGDAGGVSGHAEDARDAGDADPASPASSALKFRREKG